MIATIPKTSLVYFLALTLMRWLCTFPISVDSNTKKPYLSYKSIFTIINVGLLLFSIFDSIVAIVVWSSSGGGINRGFLIVYIIVSVIFGINLHFFARRWPNLCEKWTSLELKILRSSNEKPKTNLKKRMLQQTIFMFLLSTIGNTLYTTFR